MAVYFRVYLIDSFSKYMFRNHREQSLNFKDLYKTLVQFHIGFAIAFFLLNLNVHKFVIFVDKALLKER